MMLHLEEDPDERERFDEMKDLYGGPLGMVKAILTMWVATMPGGGAKKTASIMAIEVSRAIDNICDAQDAIESAGSCGEAINMLRSVATRKPEEVTKRGG